MKIDPKIVDWVEAALDTVSFGEVCVVFHVRKGSIDWIEKMKRETSKNLLTTVPECEKFEPTE